MRCDYGALHVLFQVLTMVLVGPGGLVDAVKASAGELLRLGEFGRDHCVQCLRVRPPTVASVACKYSKCKSTREHSTAASASTTLFIAIVYCTLTRAKRAPTPRPIPRVRKRFVMSRVEVSPKQHFR